ncbi:MAG: hypothetical protein ACK5JR_18810 [Tropicimonas sp.]|uniref:hypothetical protein n=1 Tax=Tropicimonas sp. TaxID=2067044 RepID=UPI003A88625A
MSEADSFIDEVNEEVRRERLFRTLRKYGWIGVLAVVVIVAGAAYNEYSKARASAAAQALGDEIVGALGLSGPQMRASALDGIEVDGAVAGVVALLKAAEDLAAEDPAAAVEALTPLAARTDIPGVYADLAAFKIVLTGGEAVDRALRDQLLERLATPGAPFRPLALEQQAIGLAAAGETDAAIAAARALLDEPLVTPALARRVTQLLLALGAEMGNADG